MMWVDEAFIYDAIADPVPSYGLSYLGWVLFLNEVIDSLIVEQAYVRQQYYGLSPSDCKLPRPSFLANIPNIKSNLLLDFPVGETDCSPDVWMF
jgi:hypothetical protein